MNKDLTADLKQHALARGIDLIGITSANPFVIQKEKETIADPKELLSDARAIVITGFYMKENDNTISDESIEPRGRFNAYNVQAFTPMLAYYRKTIKEFLEKEGYRVVSDKNFVFKQLYKMTKQIREIRLTSPFPLLCFCLLLLSLLSKILWS